ncbi:hypothetical protein MASR2M29_18300 [Spirochaetota bacterium]
MIKIAVSSLAFKSKDTDSVLAAAASIGAQGVEWCDKGFLLPGDEKTAAELMMTTLRAGLTSVSYACNFSMVQADTKLLRAALKSAKALNSPILRIIEPECSGTDFKARDYIKKMRLFGDEAASQGLTLCISFVAERQLQGGGAAEIMADLGHPFVKTSWEPKLDRSFDDCMESFSLLKGKIAAMLVNHKILDGSTEKKSEEWMHFMDAYDWQGGSPDMSRPIIICSLPEKLSAIQSAVDALKNFGIMLRRYHGLRVY